MTPAALLLVALTAVLPALQAPTDLPAQAAEAIRADILAREHELVRATGARDRAALEVLVAPDFVIRGTPDLDRDAWIHNAVTLCWGDRAEIDEFRVRVLGQAALASFVLTTYQDPKTCQPAVLRSLVTDLWTRGGGEWRLSVRHAGAAGKAGVENQYAKLAPPPPVWSVDAELSFVATGGNAATQTLGVGGSFEHRGQAERTKGRVNLIRTRTDGVDTARALDAELRQARTVAGKLEVFGRPTYARNLFAGIRHRLGVELGLARTLTPHEGQTLRVNAGLGAALEERVGSSTLRYATTQAGFAFDWPFRPNADLADELSFTEDLQRGSNWRLSHTFSLQVAMNHALSVRLAHRLDYRNLPVPGFKRTDTTLSAALVVTVRRRPRQ